MFWTEYLSFEKSQKIKGFRIVRIAAHRMWISYDTTVYVFVNVQDVVNYFWTWNKIATVLLYIQIQDSLNKTPQIKTFQCSDTYCDVWRVRRLLKIFWTLLGPLFKYWPLLFDIVWKISQNWTILFNMFTCEVSWLKKCPQSNNFYTLFSTPYPQS